MIAVRHAAIALKCHASSACEAVHALHVRVRVHDGRLVLSYALGADLKRLRIQAQEAPRHAHELWRHTCFEAFFGGTGSPGYCELNFAPSRAWAMYRFSARREGMAIVTDARAPEIALRRSATGLTLAASVFWRDLIPTVAPLKLRLAAAAVLDRRHDQADLQPP